MKKIAFVPGNIRRYDDGSIVRLATFGELVESMRHAPTPDDIGVYFDVQTGCNVYVSDESSKAFDMAKQEVFGA